MIPSSRNRWWVLKKADVGSAVASVAQAILADDMYRREQFARFGRRYGGMGVLGYAAQDARWDIFDSDLNQRVRTCLVREVVDSALAQLTVGVPRAMPLTDGGDWSLQKKAKDLGQFINGAMWAEDGDAKGVLMLRDALIFGTGMLKVTHDGQKICIERVLPWEVVVDQADAMYGSPQRMYQTRLVDRATLESMFGASEAIEAAGADQYGYQLFAGATNSDAVSVYEAWSLPSEKGAKDGRHVICTTAGVLLDEPWTDCSFPFVILTFTKPLIGIWGSGMAEELAPLEANINRLDNANSLAMKLHGVPMVLVEAGSQFNVAKMTNAPGQVYTYTGTKPEVITHSVVAQETIQAMDRWRASAFERYGLNQMQAAGVKPAGVQSGIAIRTLIDLTSTRLGPVQRSYEKAMVEVGRKLIDAARDLYTKYGVNFTASGPDKKFLKKIKWTDVDLDDSQYTLQVFPVNLLAKEPGARLEQVNEMLASGLIQPQMAMSLLQFPDIEAEANLANSPISYSNMIVEAILERGQYIGPTPFTPFEEAKKTMLLALTKAECDGAPEEKLDMMRQWLEECDRLQNPPPPPAPLGAPMSDPMAAPLPQDPMMGGMPPSGTVDPGMAMAEGMEAPIDDSMVVGGPTNV